MSDGHGLTLKIQPSGTKSWVLRVSTQGRVSDVSLGQWPDVSLMQARQAARKKRRAIGQEPPRGYVLADAWRLWKGLKRGRIVSYQDEKRRMERYIIKPLGSRQIDEITAPLVIHTVRSIEAQRKLATLKRVLMRTREVLDLAVCAGYIEHNPIERVSRVFPPPRVKSMPSVPWAELPAVMSAMKSSTSRTQRLFLWQLATMLRPGEAAKARKNWIVDDVLSIPADEMKKRREHRVPLTDLMRRIISCSGNCRSPFLFPGTRSGKPISSQAVAQALHGSVMRNRLVAHGLRSMARSWMADHGARFEVAEACLAHVVGSAVSRAYQRSDFLDSRRPLMAAWSAFIERCAREVEFLPGIAYTTGDSDR